MDTSGHGAIFIPGQTTSYTNGTTTQTVSSPGSAFGIVKPGEDVIIKMYKGMKPANAPANVYVAAEVIEFVGPQVR